MAEAAPCQFLEWDTKFFGVRTARVLGDALTPPRVAEIDRWCREQGVEWLYFLARADDATTARCAADAKFMLADVRMTFERPLAGDVPAAHPTVRPFAPADLPAVRRIGRASYTDSRFYFDGRISRERCDDLFDTWTVESCNGKSQSVLVADRGGEVVGYVACDVAPGSDRASIGLIGVAEAARGRGVGRALVESAVAWAAAEGLAWVNVVTQARNVLAQRLYQRCGFVTRSVGLYYHKWYE